MKNWLTYEYGVFDWNAGTGKSTWRPIGIMNIDPDAVVSVLDCSAQPDAAGHCVICAAGFREWVARSREEVIADTQSALP